MLKLMNLSLHKTSSFLTFLLIIIIASVTNAQSNNIIYETVSKQSLSVSGKTIGFQSKNLYAFATPYLKAFSLKTKGLIDFEIKSVVKNNQFTLSFLDQSQDYIFGVFHDKNKNGLLDLSSEEFYFSQTIDNHLIVDHANHRDISLKVLGADDSKDIGIKVFGLDNRLLFTRQFSNSNITLNNLPLQCKFKVYSTLSMDNYPIALTEEGIHYDISQYPQSKFDVKYPKPWFPLKLNIQYDQSKYYLTLNSIARSSSLTLNDFQIYDMPHDQYFISMYNKTTKEKVLDSPLFNHPSNQELKFEFSKKYFVEFDSNVHQKKCKIYKDKKLLYQGGNPLKLELMQAGNYTVELYDRLKKSIRKQNKKLLKNYEQIDFILDQQTTNTKISSLISSYQEKAVNIQLYNQKTITSQEGQIIFLQKKEEALYSNLIHHLPIQNINDKGLIHTNIVADPKQILYLHFDFNSNFIIDKTEEEYVRGFQWSDLQNTLSLPQVKAGFLEISGNISKPNQHFVTVKNTLDNTILISNYLSKEVVSYQSLPIEIDLEVIVTYDSNNDEVPGDGDFIYPTVYTRIRANKLSEKLVLELNEK